VIPNGIQHLSFHINTFSNIYTPLWHNRQVSQTANSATKLVLNSVTNNRRGFKRFVKGSIIVNYLDIIQQWNIPLNFKTQGQIIQVSLSVLFSCALIPTEHLLKSRWN
jgi:hypothetical protein